MSPNLKAFLDLVAHSEIGSALLAASDDGYNVLVGSTPAAPKLFESYKTHPKQLVQVRPGLFSTAAGRYQILGHYFDVYRDQLRLPDFGHESQDAIATQMIRECHALDDIEAGRIESAVSRCSSRWASFPGAGYQQHENDMGALLASYTAAGGSIQA